MKFAPLALLLAACSPVPTCESLKAEAEISIKAAEVCTGAMVGCSLDYAQVREIVAQTRRAERACRER